MAYTDDAVRAKLSSLQESQESIVTVSQWIMFHRRNADRTVQLWSERLRDASMGKKLNLIYLANEVVQQSKARKKDDFVRAFTPVIAEATANAYNGATIDIQGKLGRVIAVWRERGVFPPQVQGAIEFQCKEVDRSREGSKKARLGGSLLSASESSHPDLQPINTAYTALAKAETSSTSTNTTAMDEYARQTGPDAPTSISADARAGKLTALLKNLATAESSVGDAIKARQTLINSLETLLAAQRTKLTSDEGNASRLASNRVNIESLKRTVEAEIMRNIESSANGTAMNGEFLPGSHDPNEPEPLRPEEEPLTPPAVESFTPTGSPRAVTDGDTLGFQGLAAPIPNPTGADYLLENLAMQTFEDQMPVPNADQLSTSALANLTQPTNVVLDPRRAHLGDNNGTPINGAMRQTSGGNVGSDPRLAKRPRLGSGQLSGGDGSMHDEYSNFANDGKMSQMDDDIGAMLNG